MAVVTVTQATGPRPCAVLRPICIDGKRVEVGERVDLTVAQAAELTHAGKVAPWVEPPKPAKPTKPTQEAQA